MYTTMRFPHGGALLNARTCIEVYTTMRFPHGGALLNARTCIEVYTTGLPRYRLPAMFAARVVDGGGTG
jgi:hypothetical protein